MKIFNIVKKINYILDAKQKRNFVILVFVFIFGAFWELFGVSAIAPLISLLTDPSVFETNMIYIKICELLHISTISDMAFLMAIVIALIYVIKNAILCMQYDIMYRYTYHNQQRLSVRMLNCYLKQDYLYHVANNIADIQRNITTDVGQFLQCLLAFMRFLAECFVCLFLVVFLLVSEFAITITAIVVLAFFMIIFLNLYRKKISKLGEINRQKGAEQYKWILQSFGGIKDVKTLGREAFFINKYDVSYLEYAETNRKYNLLISIQKPIIEAGCFSGLLLIVALRIRMGVNLGSLVASLGVFAVAAFRMLPSFNRITENINNMFYYKASINALYEDLQELELLEAGLSAKISDGYINPASSINIKDITFKYPAGENNIFENVSFTIEPNQSIGIIGASGEGKSTFADIILGLIRPDKGDITVEDNSIFENLDAWHHIVGYIPQAIYLMDDSIRNNIAFGIDEEEIDDERIMQVIEDAQLADFVKTLPNGINTFVGDRGVRLSGGQRQRVGIARALYSDPKFLVLDEATSSLDNDTETAVMEAIDKLHGSRTMLIIAHRLTTIRNCDVVYEVKNKNIIKVDKPEILTR